MPPRVDFYLIEEAGDAARLRIACKFAEKAYLAKQKVVVFSDDASLLPRFDEMLWTFGDGSFVPHDTVTAGKPCEAPVALTSGTPPEDHADVLINLSGSVPAFFEKFERVPEFLGARREIRGSGRERLKAYRGKSIEPQTHTV